MTQPESSLSTMTYAVDGAVARITLNRPERGNGLTLATPVELAACVERANLDPAVHVIALAGNGKGFCGGYDLEASAAQGMRGQPVVGPPGSPLDWRDDHQRAAGLGRLGVSGQRLKLNQQRAVLQALDLAA